jgi:hypothetical protein
METALAQPLTRELMAARELAIAQGRGQLRVAQRS